VTQKKGGSVRRALQRSPAAALQGGETPAMGSTGPGSARAGSARARREGERSGSRSICPGASTSFLGTSPTTTTPMVCAS